MRLKLIFSIMVLFTELIFSAGITGSEAEFFKKRRQQLMDKAGKGVIVLAAPSVKNRNSDIDYKYRQSSNIYYLTGLEMSGVKIVLIPGDKKPYKVFVPHRSPFMDHWVGPVPGKKELMEIYGADEVLPFKKMKPVIMKAMRGGGKLYVDMSNKEFMENLSDEIPGMKRVKSVENIASLLGDLRLIKDSMEIELLDKVVAVTGEAVIESMKRAAPGLYEYQVGAVVDYVYKNRGCMRVGFPSIIASGKNGEILHYEHNNRKMRDGELLLMDIGAEYKYYSGDISRTFPVNGKFNKRQKEIYNIVLNSQKKGLAEIKPGNGFKDVMRATLRELSAGLLKAGLITEEGKLWQVRVWAKFFQFSHWLGLDTHDIGGYEHGTKRGIIFKPGMVLTLEPGLYIGDGGIDKAVALYKGRVPDAELKEFVKKVKPVYEKFRNISIRIEDDILVTEKGNRVLSASVPKEVKDIEKLMRKRSRFN